MKNSIIIAVIYFLGVAGAFASNFKIYVSYSPDGTPTYSHVRHPSNGGLHMTVAKRSKSHIGEQVRAINAGANRDIFSLVTAAANMHGVPRNLILAIIQVESQFDTNAQSTAGALGLMQVMPETAKEYGVYRNIEDPKNNIDVGVRYLKDMLYMFNNDIKLALAAYNAGPGAVKKHGMQIPPYKETQAYVPLVLNYYYRYGLDSKKF